ncbi:MAG: cell division protein ZapA [Muribaculaceae bacterium]|nr:cell division protein ZapA [Muribaculaceae bacterium]
MKGSDKIEMTINIGGELIKLDVDFDDQIGVREAESEIKLFIDRMKKKWPQNSDKKLLAMAAFQFARWYQQLINFQMQAIDITNENIRKIDNILNNDIDADTSESF